MNALILVVVLAIFANQYSKDQWNRFFDDIKNLGFILFFLGIIISIIIGGIWGLWILIEKLIN